MKNRKQLLAIPVVLVGALIAWRTLFRAPFRYAGTVEATDVDLSPRISSTISTVTVHEGDRVAAGQPLVELGRVEPPVRDGGPQLFGDPVTVGVGRAQRWCAGRICRRHLGPPRRVWGGAAPPHTRYSLSRRPSNRGRDRIGSVTGPRAYGSASRIAL